MQQHMNHISESTAFYINNFPFAFATNTRARYWVETKPAYGQRLHTQYQTPGSTSWYKAKHSGYFDVVILATNANQTDPNFGLLQPILIELKNLSTEHLILFSTYYTFTPYQKEIIMKHFAIHKIYRAPIWKNDIELDYNLNKIAETNIDKDAMVLRKTDSNGIPIQSHLDALKEHNKTKKGIDLNDPHPYTADKPHGKKENQEENPTMGMSPEQLAIYNSVMGLD